MSEILSTKAIQILTTKVTDMMASAISHTRLKADAFEKQAATKETSDYLSDVVFEKSGHIFPKIKANYKGKPLATTKKELFEQLMGLSLDKYDMGVKTVAERVKNNISKLDDVEIKTIASISKLFLEITDNRLNETIAPHLLLSPDCLSTIKNLFTHSRNLSFEEIKSIINNSGYNSFKHINTLLNISPQKIENYKLKAFVEHSNTINKEYLNNIINNKNLNSSEMLDEVIKQNSIDCVKDNPVLINDILDRYSVSLSELMRRINIAKEKLESVNDKKIKEFVNQTICNPESEFSKNLRISKNYFIAKDGIKELEKNELLLEADLGARNLYSPINGDAHEYYKLLDKKNSSDSAKVEDLQQQIAILKSDPEKQMDTYRAISNVSKGDLFNESTRLEPLKLFIGKYATSEPIMANYLYEQCFLTKISDNDAKSLLRKIRDEFGTMVFVENNRSILYLDEIYSELLNWKIASKGQAKFPAVFDFSHTKKSFIRESDIYTKAYCRKWDSSISMPMITFKDSDFNDSIRHEMIHLNDTQDEKYGVINGIDFDEIKQSQKYKSELQLAGIHGYSLEYAHQDKKEFVAVAGTGEWINYSDEFKQILVKLGMPECVADLKQDIIPYDIAYLLRYGFIDQIERPHGEELDYSVPNGIILIGNDFNFNDIARWLARKSGCKREKIDFAKMSQEEAMNELDDISEKAKKNNQRTLIQINNFERFTIPTVENAKIIEKLKSCLPRYAEDNKCTIIVQTDNPSKIDPNVMSEHHFGVKINSNGI